jgi:hypothetical protein
MNRFWQSSLFRRTAHVLQVVLLCAFMFGEGVHLAQAQSANVALNKPVTCSSTQSGSFPCANAVDGNTGTRWSSAFSDPQWIQIDLGATYSLTSVVLRWETAYGKAFQIQVSPDASTWTTLYTTTTGTGSVQTIPVSGSGRYIRMYGTVRNTQWGYSLWEFEVYAGNLPTNTFTPTSTSTRTNTPTSITSTPTSTLSRTLTPTQTGTPSTNIALRKPATCSSLELASFPCANAVDGNTGTRWSSAFSDPQWIQIDLGATYDLTSVILRWEAAYGRAFQIQVSPDAVTWTSIYSTTTGTGGVQTIPVSGSGRYIRMYGTVRSTPYGYSLWEFEVYAGNPPPITLTPTRTSTGTIGPSNTPTRTPTPTVTRTQTATPTQGTPIGPIMLSYQAPAVASSIQDNANCTGCTADKVVDMNMSTRWAADWSDPSGSTWTWAPAPTSRGSF